MDNTRRQALIALGMAGSLSLLTSCRKGEEKPAAGSAPSAPVPAADLSQEEYVWLAPHSNLPLFVAHDHPALQLAGKSLGVKVTIAGPSTIDIPALVGAIEQTAARNPAGMLVAGWDPSALVAPINKAVEAGVPVVCVDCDVPTSRRLAFVGTNWFDVGREQALAMVRALNGRKGKVALLGLIEQTIDQQAFEGFRAVASQAGLTAMEPQHDRGNSVEAARVASSLLQAIPDLVGIAGFDSESGPGIGLAVKEAGKTGKIIATCVDAEEQHLRLIQEGVLTAAVGQKRELFTYFGLHLLFEIRHSPLRLTTDDKAAGVVPIPQIVYTGSYTVTRENVGLFLKKA
jgi:ribose transport system substrate-binding protein